MIVNQTLEGWEIVYHRSHALLAALIASRWDRPEHVERLAETIIAVAGHDDHVREWRGNQLTPAGAPRDFMLSDDDPGNVEPWRRLLADARLRGRWVALLTAMHVRFITEPQAGQSEVLDTYRAELEAQEQRWREELGVSEDEARHSYAFLQWCDRCSLILCQRELPDRERRLEVSPGSDGVRYEIWQRTDDEVVVVEPWPFRDERFTLTVDTCVLSQMTFASAEELIVAMRSAPTKEQRWEFARDG